MGFADFNSVGVRPFGVRGGFDSLALPPLNLTVSSRDPDYFLVGVSLRLLPVCYPTSKLGVSELRVEQRGEPFGGFSLQFL